MDNFTGGAEQADDITMLALEIISFGQADSLIKPDMKEMTVEANTDRLDEIIDFLNAELDSHNCPAELQNQIDVAADEIFTNIANYAYKPESGKTAVGIAIGNEVLLRFEDSGKPYNPLESTAPDLDKPLMEREIGGLGVFILKKFMDTINYSRVDNKNVLVMTKRIN